MAFAVAATVIALLMFGLSWAVATARDRLVESLEAGAPTVKRWGGVALLLVASWLAITALLAVRLSRWFPV